MSEGLWIWPKAQKVVQAQTAITRSMVIHIYMFTHLKIQTECQWGGLMWNTWILVGSIVQTEIVKLGIVLHFYR